MSAFQLFNVSLHDKRVLRNAHKILIDWQSSFESQAVVYDVIPKMLTLGNTITK